MDQDVDRYAARAKHYDILETSSVSSAAPALPPPRTRDIVLLIQPSTGLKDASCQGVVVAGLVAEGKGYAFITPDPSGVWRKRFSVPSSRFFGAFITVPRSALRIIGSVDDTSSNPWSGTVNSRFLISESLGPSYGGYPFTHVVGPDDYVAGLFFSRLRLFPEWPKPMPRFILLMLRLVGRPYMAAAASGAVVACRSCGGCDSVIPVTSTCEVAKAVFGPISPEGYLGEKRLLISQSMITYAAMRMLLAVCGCVTGCPGVLNPLAMDATPGLPEEGWPEALRTEFSVLAAPLEWGWPRSFASRVKLQYDERGLAFGGPPPSGDCVRESVTCDDSGVPIICVSKKHLEAVYLLGLLRGPKGEPAQLGIFYSDKGTYHRRNLCKIAFIGTRPSRLLSKLGNYVLPKTAYISRFHWGYDLQGPDVWGEGSISGVVAGAELSEPTVSLDELVSAYAEMESNHWMEIVYGPSPAKASTVMGSAPTSKATGS